MKDNQEFSLGMDVGIYLIAGLMAEGFDCTQRGWEILKAARAADIEKATNTPAEDVALLMQPAIDMMVKSIEEAKAR